MIKAIHRFTGLLKSFERIDDCSSERLSKSFERLDVFNKRVSKSFERLDVFLPKGCKSFERLDVFDKRVSKSFERLNAFLTNRWAKNDINESFERWLDVSTEQVIKLFEWMPILFWTDDPRRSNECKFLSNDFQTAAKQNSVS